MITIDEFMNKKYPDGYLWGKLNILECACTLLPQIIWCAQNASLMTYGDMAANLSNFPYTRGNAFSYSTGLVAGLVGDYCKACEKPLLNSLIVNARHLIPSDGIDDYLENLGIRQYEDLTPEQKKSIMENDIWPRVFKPGIWDDMLASNDAIPQEPEHYRNYFFNENINLSDIVIKNLPKSTVSKTESDAHKKLKDYVSKNPGKIELLNPYSMENRHSSTEYAFPSMDIVDVYFQNEYYKIACEVKSYLSDASDILRGIFQCVKYRALINAANKIERKPPVGDCILIIQNEMPDELRPIAEQLDVKYCVLSSEIVNN